MKSDHSYIKPIEIFKVFLKLGLTSFGGPIAHIGYFYREFVIRRKWLSESEFTQLVALSQVLPGPASSQIGFCIGFFKAQWRGALLAFVAFTFPSAVLLTIFAKFYSAFSAQIALMHALKLVALVVVASGVLSMLRRLCPDISRIMIATLSAFLILYSGGAVMQLLLIMMSGFLGALICKLEKPLGNSILTVPYGRAVGVFFLLIFALSFVPSLFVDNNRLLQIFTIFYHAGALVFGGGHVVLPLLEEAIVKPGLMSLSDFLSGYGAAQAVPGPMFSLAAFLGDRLADSGQELIGAGIALFAIFLPGFLLILGALPFLRLLASNEIFSKFVMGINAGVVGLLAAALYNPILLSAVHSLSDILIALVGFVLLHFLGFNSILIILWCVTATYGIFYLF